MRFRVSLDTLLPVPWWVIPLVIALLSLLTGERSPFVAWDGQWYLSIATSGYHAEALQGLNRHDFAFFPFWPLLIRAAGIAPLPISTVAPALANVLFVAAALATYRVLWRHFDKSAARWSLALFSFAPPAFVFSIAYSESAALLFIALYFVPWPSVLWRPFNAAMATITRVTGAAVFLAAVVGARQRHGACRRWLLFAALAALAGLGAWVLAVGIITGDPLGILHGGLGWQQSFGFRALVAALRPDRPVAVLQIGFVALILAFALGLVWRDLELATYALAVLGLGILLGRQSSMARYTLMAFPAFGLLAARASRATRLLLLIAFGAGQVLFAMLAFAGGSDSQPP